MTDHQDRPAGAGAESFREWAEAKLAARAGSAADDPLANGVRRLGLALASGLENDTLTLDDVARFAKTIADDALRARADRFAAAHAAQPDFPETLTARLEHMDFATARRALERPRFGVVFTAHPTFAVDPEIRTAFAAYAEGPTPDAELSFRAALAGRPHKPATDPTLSAEHAEALLALGRAQDANRALLGACIGWARTRWPSDWRAFAPRPISLATWVGYDLDGRTDIHWGETFRFRLAEKALQLDRYASALRGVEGAKDHARLEALAVAFSDAAGLARRQAAAFGEDLSVPENVVAAANALTAEDAPGRLTSLAGAIGVLDAVVAAEPSDAAAQAISIIRAEMKSYGLGVAHIHLRVNAAQVRSALRADLGLRDEQEFLDRSTLEAAARVASAAKARRINFATVFREKMTARRQFMLCAQFIKHVDADSPIRFLIAECEAPATVMGAVYLARLYGVADNVDISPLFETPEALERGGRFMERLLDEAPFRSYVEARGRVAIQLGFSDSGRFMGQIAADMVIERLHILLARGLADRGLRNVEAVVFNTHGESAGRGGYQGSLRDRFDHIMTPWARARYRREGIALNIEASFQGGDGFLHFQTAALARATLAAVFAWVVPDQERDPNDLFYQDINYSWDVYRAIKAWQEDLYERPSYQTALSAFGPNLLVKSGSRKTRRQSGASARDAARALRAIPHNAILQQLAAPANIIGGLGAAAEREPERFIALVRGSARFGALMGMARTARILTSLSTLRAYASIYDPAFWIIRARLREEGGSADAAKRAGQFCRIATALEAAAVDVDLSRLANHLSTDRRRLDAVLARDGRDGEFPRELYLLHAVKLSLIMRGLEIVAALPDFSGRHDLSHDSLMRDALGLDFAAVAASVAQIFPRAESRDSLSGLTEAADPSESDGGYDDVHLASVAPLLRIDALLKEIGVAVSHFYGAYG